MATLTIHNIPDDLLEKLRRSARENGRDIEKEAVVWLSRIEDPHSPEVRPKEEMLKSFRELSDHYPNERITRAEREGRLGDCEDPYRIVPSRFTSLMKPEEFIEYTQRLSRKLEGKVWATEEDVNRSKREGRL